ncbi:MAG TPA: hypothetical protein VFG91_01265 [Woeseiaceae bacterium]|nr:hypothetical protein [Woeseiaceae bacterium]
MQKLLKILIGIVAVFALAVAAVFYLTSGMVDTANTFFSALKNGDIATAHTYLSEEFKAGTDEAELKQFLTKSALLQFKEASWSNRQISGGRGELNGAVTTETGGIIPLKLTFITENGDWKIYAIQKPAAGLQIENSQGIPDQAEQVALVKRSMHDFAISVNQKSMEHFRTTLSELWQDEVTVDALDQAFGTAYDTGLDFRVFDHFEPVIEPVAALEQYDVLVLTGYFPTEPDQLYFEQKFIYEGFGWKLFGFSFEIK